MKVGALDQSYNVAKFSSRSELMLGSYDVPYRWKNQPKKQQRLIFSTKKMSKPGLEVQEKWLRPGGESSKDSEKPWWSKIVRPVCP